MNVSITIAPIVPPGTSQDFMGPIENIPYGFLLEDHSIKNIADYPRLFEMIGTVWGGDGVTTFRLPPGSGRVSVGAGDAAAGITTREVGQTGGEENHVLNEAELPSHTHIQNEHWHETVQGEGIYIPTDTSPTPPFPGARTAEFKVAGVTHTGGHYLVAGEVITLPGGVAFSVTPTNQETGGDVGHNNMQPFRVTNKIIKY